MSLCNRKDYYHKGGKMKIRRTFFLVMLLCQFVMADNAFAFSVNTRAISSGTYEDGDFTPGNEEFEAEYIIDEENEEIILQRVFKNDREGRIEDGISYEITNVVVSEGISALLVSRNKKGQKIYTAVREGGLGASETLMVGEDFYQFCRAANGKFYLEYGEVRTER
jgi:hypothetical protein